MGPVSFCILRLLCKGSLCPSNRLNLLHALLDGGLREVGPLLELLQDPRALILLLESFEGTINRFVFGNYDADQNVITSFTQLVCLAHNAFQ